MLRITVIGAGYLGTTHAACMAELGFQVLAMDADPAKVAALSTGRVPFYEPGLAELVHRHVQSGQLRFTTSYRETASFGADVHFLCVGTPQQNGRHAADLRFVEAALDELAPHLVDPCVVVGKSTVPVGTAERLARRLTDRAPIGDRAEVAWNPEFLREGFAIEDTLKPSRLVFGVASQRAEALLRDVYRPVMDQGVPLVVTDLPTAELVKVSANAFLATKISFVNAMAEVCDATGADVVTLSEALSYDHRIGGAYLGPGLGFGGGCLPKDIRAFVARADELGVDLGFLREVDEINKRRRTRMVDIAREQCGGTFSGKRVAVWGAAFKPNSDDVRDSPALDVAAAIQRKGAQVTVYDPKAMDNARTSFPNLAYAASAVGAAADAHLVMHLTDWREFSRLDPEVVGRVVRVRRVVDGRNMLNARWWRTAGWHYRALGRP
jgi:UDPglucose 6-dehydrogenase